MSLKTAMSVLTTTMSLKMTMFVQKCRCWRPAASHQKQRRDAVAPCPFDKSSRYQRLFSCILTLCMQPTAIATLSVCIALLCLSQSESLTGPSVNLHNLKNTTYKILPCPTQPSPSKLCVPCVLSTRPRIPMQFLFLLVQGGHH